MDALMGVSKNFLIACMMSAARSTLPLLSFPSRQFHKKLIAKILIDAPMHMHSFRTHNLLWRKQVSIHLLIRQRHIRGDMMMEIVTPTSGDVFSAAAFERTERCDSRKHASPYQRWLAPLCS
jgi:hypothetical protein